ncbi:MAG TPA: amidophosphoribosyltransferase [Candidatus Flavonifractor merdipullorum]|uniref:Amidophosphoribosyltransferase n=1 Tax=Candidatus Flavonifractor merdipullorum TaxID=2838590 RepID=A0A9D1UNW6_9FIRM|nr:amidophosphoribosyltransferase [Candidatus Flavonifractor merdipullorum]
MSQLHEECGVFGLYTHEPEAAAIHTYHALYALQHRGQESAGIAINDDGVISSHKDVGLVSEVFPPDVLQNLGSGTITVGHVRYATTGNKSRTNAQPLVINHVKGSMVLAHNGNLTNAAELREKLELSGAIFHTTSDTEVIAYTITAQRLTAPSIEEAVDAAMDIIQGAYSLVLMSSTKLIAARDPNGFRPLCIGTMEDGGYVFASESCALDAIGAHFLRDVEPGEIVIADGNGLRSIRTHCNGRKSSLCVFEFIYFARPDSVIDGASVHEARLRAGAFLALEHPVQADIVIGVPDSGLDAAVGYARQSGIPYGIGFIKNKYIARTFIAPGQKSREDKVRIKLNPIASVVKGKRVVMIDDSIVRGTTSQRIVKLLRDAGAKEVHVRVSAPPFLHPCYFGTDIDSRDHLIACNHTTEEIAEIIGADSLGYLSVDSVHKLAVGCGCTFCDGCFTGNYPVAVPETREKFRFETKLSQRKD